MSTITEEIQKLSRDVKEASRTLGRREARFLVDYYYAMQDYRIASANQVRSMSEDDEPHATVAHLTSQMGTLENQVKRVLDVWTDSHELGQWAKSQVGIGPVISAGLLAHIDIEKAPTAGHVWRFAGLDPTQHWGKGEKRPWNAQLKTLCWKLGESFVKVSGRDDAFYAQLYTQRKQYELERDVQVWEVDPLLVKHGTSSATSQIYYVVRDSEMITVYLIGDRWFAGGNAGAAQKALGEKKIGKDTDAYKAYIQGHLPPAQLHARAKRYAVKIFLAHYLEVGRDLAGLEVPNPYAIDVLGHAHRIRPPR